MQPGHPDGGDEPGGKPVGAEHGDRLGGHGQVGGAASNEDERVVAARAGIDVALLHVDVAAPAVSGSKVTDGGVEAQAWEEVV